MTAPELSTLKTKTTALSSTPFWNVRGLAILWVILFSIVFYSFDLPNNPEVSRMDIWKQVPFLLLDLIDPGQEHPHKATGWKYLSQRSEILIITGIILAGLWSLGHLVLRGIRVPLPSRSPERTVLAMGLGFSGFSLITLGLGYAGLLSRNLFAALILCGVLGELLFRWREHAQKPSMSSSARESETELEQRSFWKSVSWWCWLVVTPFLLSMMLGAMLPSIDFDVKEYHLQGPKEYFQQGQIRWLPHNVYTSFPFLTEMLTLMGMVLADDVWQGALCGKLTLMMFAPVTAMAIYSAGQRWFSSSVGMLAAIIFLTTPWTYRISVIAYAEGGLTCFLFLTCFALLLSLEFRSTEEHHTSSHRMIFVTGLLAGSAMACKYPGVISVVVPIGITLMIALRKKFSSQSLLKPLLIYTLGGDADDWSLAAEESV